MKKIVFLMAIALFPLNIQAQEVEVFPDFCKIMPNIDGEGSTGNIQQCREFLINHYINPNAEHFIIEGSEYQKYDLVASCEEFGCCTAQEVDTINAANEEFKEKMLQKVNSSAEKLMAFVSEEEYQKNQQDFLEYRNKLLKKLVNKIRKIKLSAENLKQCKKKLIDIYTNDSNGVLKSKSLKKDCADAIIAARRNSQPVSCKAGKDDFEVVVMCSPIFKKEISDNIIYDKEVSFPDFEQCCTKEIVDAQEVSLENFRNIIRMGIETMIEDANDGEERIAEFYEMRNNALHLLQLENEQNDSYDEYKSCFERKLAQNNLRIKTNEIIAKNADMIANDGTQCYDPNRSLYNAQPNRICPRYIDGNLTKNLMPECHAFMFDKINKLELIRKEKQYKTELEAQDDEKSEVSEGTEKEKEQSVLDMEDNEFLAEKCKERISWLYENSEKLLEDGQTFGDCEKDNDGLCQECPAQCEKIEKRLVAMKEELAEEKELKDEQKQELMELTTELKQCQTDCKTTCATAKCCHNFATKPNAIKEKYAEYVKADIDTFNQELEDGNSLYEALYNLDLKAALSFEKNNNNIISYERSVAKCVNEEN